MKETIDKDIISEIHRTREAIAKRFDYNIKAIFANVMNRQKQHGTRLASPLPKKKRGESGRLD